MAFQQSTKKEDVSMKLRAQNMKGAQQVTQNLEKESEKMEQRLQELKLAMMQEKEQRERTGRPGFWSRGQEGSLTDYATEVLNKPAKSAKKKVKVLKDEPVVVPTRPSGPGTMGYIAKRGVSNGSAGTGREKFKGPKCGQCEEKAAHVMCQECGEYYCARCFASFHLKGALKKHRSLPVGASGMRTPREGVVGGGEMLGLTPRSAQSAQALANGRDIQVLEGDPDSASSTPMCSARSDYGGRQQPTGGPSLLEGSYDERDAAADFQRALAEWRTGKKGSAQSDATSNGVDRSQRDTRSARGKENRQPQKRVNFVPHPPHEGISVEEGTGMEGFDDYSQQQIDIKFHSDLTYAEKLMLKRARRTQLGPMPGTSPSESGRSSLGGGAVTPPFMMSFSEVEVMDQGALAMAELMESEPQERVDFKALFGAVNRPYCAAEGYHRQAESSAGAADEYQESPSRSESRLSVIELAESTPRRHLRGLEQTSQCDVTEVRDGDYFSAPAPSILAIRNTQYQPERVMYSTSPRGASKKPSSARKESTKSRLSKSSQKQNKPIPKSEPVKTSHNQPVSEMTMSERVGSAFGGRNIIGEVTIESVEFPREELVTPTKKSNKQSSRLSASQSTRQSPQQDELNLEKDLSFLDKPPKQTAPTSARQRAPPSARQSARGERSRPGSRAATSRPQSRAQSRLSQFGEGQLTKEPSEALREIAQLSRELTSQIIFNSEKRFSVGDFLTAGVDPEPPSTNPDMERTLTPTANRRPSSSRPGSVRRPPSARQRRQEGEIEKWKVSNRLYSMTPRSWKPDFSLTDTVSEEQVLRIAQETIETSNQLDREAEFNMAAEGDNGGLFSGADDLAEQVALVGVQRMKNTLNDQSEDDLNRPMRAQPSSRSHWDPPTQLRPTSRPVSARPDSAGPDSARLNSARPKSTRPDSARPDSARPDSARLNSARLNSARLNSARPGSAKPKRPLSARREGSHIVMDGEDLSLYDHRGEPDQQNTDDSETLNELEWELASQTGRLTAAGRISRLVEEGPDDNVGSPTSPNYTTSPTSPNYTTSPTSPVQQSPAEKDFDIQSQLRGSDLQDDFEEMMKALNDEYDVKQLH